MSHEITSKPDHGEEIIKESKASDRLQAFMDDLQQRLNDFLLGDAVILPEYTVATVPDATLWDNGAIIVSDETGGRTIATSDGTDWRRVSDGAVVS